MEEDFLHWVNSYKYQEDCTILQTQGHLFLWNGKKLYYCGINKVPRQINLDKICINKEYSEEPLPICIEWSKDNILFSCLLLLRLH